MGYPFKIEGGDETLEEYLVRYISETDESVSSYSKVPVGAFDAFPNVPPSLVASTFQICVIKRILIGLDQDVISKLENVCTGLSCPKMIASDEWHFLCAPHADKPRDCSAIDYMKHTVDSCSSIMLLLDGKPHSLGVKQLHSIVRRLFRIYGHLYFHHPNFFKSVELHCGKFFLFLKQFALWKQDMGIIPEDVLLRISRSSSERSGSLSARQSLAKAPSIDLRSAGTIVDLRTVAMQLEEECEEGESLSSGSDHTVIIS